MTPLSLIRIKTLSQKATNLVVPFIKIIFKVLSDYIRNHVKHFPDNIGIKEAKTIYKNKKLA